MLVPGVVKIESAREGSGHAEGCGMLTLVLGKHGHCTPKRDPTLTVKAIPPTSYVK